MHAQAYAQCQALGKASVWILSVMWDPILSAILSATLGLNVYPSVGSMPGVASHARALQNPRLSLRLHQILSMILPEFGPALDQELDQELGPVLDQEFDRKLDTSLSRT
jgi:hypothetical protein